MISIVIVAALCCAGISFTITTTSIFKWFRDWTGQLHPKLDELINCPWCFNHYVVFLYMSILNIDGYDTDNFAVRVALYFAIITLGGLFHYVLIRAYEPIAKRLLERKLRRDE